MDRLRPPFSPPCPGVSPHLTRRSEQVIELRWGRCRAALPPAGGRGGASIGARLRRAIRKAADTKANQSGFQTSQASWAGIDGGLCHPQKLSMPARAVKIKHGIQPALQKQPWDSYHNAGRGRAAPLLLRWLPRCGIAPMHVRTHGSCPIFYESPDGCLHDVRLPLPPPGAAPLEQGC